MISAALLFHLEAGLVKVDEIVTDDFELKDRGRAPESARQRRGIKSVIVPPAPDRPLACVGRPAADRPPPCHRFRVKAET